ncbi:UDP-3-O-(3-hydroxymyristoyl)glucosamine N-acyltransferase, partial [Escherichia coli]|nr:UDP-3-O-(3-hydroxymyristoyl)glucosamine N-acyltransferase [Escherichia coli]
MFSALDIKTLMQGTLYGDPSLRVDTIRPIHSPLVGGLSIVMTPGDLLHIPTTGADIIIGPEEIISSNAKAKIVVDYLNVNNLNKVLRYFKVHKYRLFEQENTSTIPDVYIGKHCQIGMNCHFMPGVKIMNCVTIGDNVAIHA